MSAKMTGEQLGAKIAEARHEAEGLKDRIKRRKDELADTSRKDIHSHPARSTLDGVMFLFPLSLRPLTRCHVLDILTMPYSPSSRTE